MNTASCFLAALYCDLFSVQHHFAFEFVQDWFIHRVHYSGHTSISTCYRIDLAAWLVRGLFPMIMGSYEFVKQGNTVPANHFTRPDTIYGHITNFMIFHARLVYLRDFRSKNVFTKIAGILSRIADQLAFIHTTLAGVCLLLYSRYCRALAPNTNAVLEIPHCSDFQ